MNDTVPLGDTALAATGSSRRFNGAPMILDQNIPIPAVQRPRNPSPGSTPRWPFAEMLVGQSFWWPNDLPRLAALAYGRRHRVRFVTRAMANERGVPGFRVWRVG